jgi:hypothetical protein
MNETYGERGDIIQHVPADHKRLVPFPSLRESLCREREREGEREREREKVQQSVREHATMKYLYDRTALTRGTALHKHLNTTNTTETEKEKEKEEKKIQTHTHHLPNARIHDLVHDPHDHA